MSKVLGKASSLQQEFSADVWLLVEYSTIDISLSTDSSGNCFSIRPTERVDFEIFETLRDSGNDLHDVTLSIDFARDRLERIDQIPVAAPPVRTKLVIESNSVS